MSKKVILLTLLSATLVSCNKIPVGDPEFTPYNDAEHQAIVDNEGFTIIDFYGLNDYHGALVSDVDGNMPGIGMLNTFLNNERKKNPGGTVLIANGDMWQGSADSNITYGKIVNQTLNYMGFAALTLGNHEFDWGIPRIAANKEYSNFPYLGANIVLKETGENPDFIDQSPLIERDGVKIGIIGTMGSDLINTIQSSLVESIQFDPITTYVKDEATRLREAGANLILLAAHDTWVNNLTPERQTLLDEKVVDAVFTGHQHYLDENLVNGIPILQTRGRGRDVMHARLGFNKTTKEVKYISSEVVKDIARMGLAKDKTSEMIYDHYYRQFEIGKIKNEVLGTIKNSDMSTSAVAKFAVEVMTKAYPEAVGAFHNVNGGIRAEFKAGKLTYGAVYNAFPFDNEIYVVEIRGSRLIGLMAGGGNYAYYFTIAANEVIETEYYKIVTISFVYELSDSPVRGLDYENKFTYPRDLIADYMREHKSIDGSKYK